MGPSFTYANNHERYTVGNNGRRTGNMKKVETTGMTELEVARLWSTLDNITSKIENVENRLEDIARLEERVNNHREALKRYGRKLDDHDDRIQKTEVWKAEQGDNRLLETNVLNMRTAVTEIRQDVNEVKGCFNEMKSDLHILEEQVKLVCDNIKTEEDFIRGKNTVTSKMDRVKQFFGAEIFKWVLAIIAGVLILRVAGTSTNTTGVEKHKTEKVIK